MRGEVAREVAQRMFQVHRGEPLARAVGVPLEGEAQPQRLELRLGVLGQPREAFYRLALAELHAPPHLFYDALRARPAQAKRLHRRGVEVRRKSRDVALADPEEERAQGLSSHVITDAGQGQDRFARVLPGPGRPQRRDDLVDFVQARRQVLQQALALVLERARELRRVEVPEALREGHEAHDLLARRRKVRAAEPAEFRRCAEPALRRRRRPGLVHAEEPVVHLVDAH